MSRPVTTLLHEVNKADPARHDEDRNPIEYEFSNGRIFRGLYRQRGPYAPEEE